MKWKTLLPAGLLAASLITVVYRSDQHSVANTETAGLGLQGSGSTEQVANQPQSKAADFKAGQRELASAKDKLRLDPVLRQFAEEQRSELWNGLKVGGLVHNLKDGAQQGADAQFSLGDKKFDGKVFFRIKEEDGSEVVAMTLANPSGSLYAKILPDGRVTGGVRYDQELSAYDLKGTRENVIVQRKTLPEVTCGRIDGAQAIVGLESNVPVTGGALPLDPDQNPPIAVPILNSNPTAQHVLYLDFITTKVTGTRWNADYKVTEINVKRPYYTIDQITAMWQMISDDFSPMKINVTTDRSKFNAAPVGKRTRAIFTYENQWFIDQTPQGTGVIGVAYLNSFNDGSDNPFWIFAHRSDGVSRGGLPQFPTNEERDAYIREREATNLALTVSHEGGHAFGLEHDGIGNLPYYGGDGTWGPIMGNPFNTPYTQWSNGDYPGANNDEDDFAIIAGSNNQMGFWADEHGNDIGRPSLLMQAFNSPIGNVETTGIINSQGDKDVFRFTCGGGDISLLATPFPDEDITLFPPDLIVGNTACRMVVRNALGEIVAEGVDPDGLTSSIDLQNMPAGLYYVEVEGVGEDSDLTTFSNYGSRGNFHIHGFVEGLNGAVVRLTEPSIPAVSIVQGNGLILNGEILNGSNNTAIQWSKLTGPGAVTFTNPTQVAGRVTFSAPGRYELQCQCTANGVTTNTKLEVSVETAGSTPVFANRGPDITLNVPATITGQFYADLVSAVTDDNVPVNNVVGVTWQLLSGNGKVVRPNDLNARLDFNQGGLFRVIQTARDGQIATFKEAEINAMVIRADYVNKGNNAKVHVPTTSALDTTWYAQGFNDSNSSWTEGKVGAGFFQNDSSGYKLKYVGGPSFELTTKMLGKSTSAYVRIPFTLTNRNAVFGARLNMYYDDGIVVYLNGQPLTRRNFGAATPAYNSTASTSRPSKDLELPVEISTGQNLINLLQEGNNVLAIHGMNASINDNDFLVLPILQLDANTTGFAASMQQGVVSAVPVPSPLPDGDEDGDGVPNFMEYASGTDPFVKDAPRAVTFADGKISFKLPTSLGADVTCHVESSANLKDWSVLASKTGQGEWTGDSTVVVGGEVSCGISYQIEVGASGAQKFYRLRYTENR